MYPHINKSVKITRFFLTKLFGHFLTALGRNIVQISATQPILTQIFFPERKRDSLCGYQIEQDGSEYSILSGIFRWVGNARLGLCTCSVIRIVFMTFSMLHLFSTAPVFISATGNPKNHQETQAQQENQRKKLYILLLPPNIHLKVAKVFLLLLFHCSKLHTFTLISAWYSSLLLVYINFRVNLCEPIPPINNVPLSAFVILSSALQQSKRKKYGKIVSCFDAKLLAVIM